MRLQLTVRASPRSGTGPAPSRPRSRWRPRTAPPPASSPPRSPRPCSAPVRDLRHQARRSPASMGGAAATAGAPVGAAPAGRRRRGHPDRCGPLTVAGPPPRRPHGPPWPSRSPTAPTPAARSSSAPGSTPWGAAPEATHRDRRPAASPGCTPPSPSPPTPSRVADLGSTNGTELDGAPVGAAPAGRSRRSAPSGSATPCSVLRPAGGVPAAVTGARRRHPGRQPPTPAAGTRRTAVDRRCRPHPTAPHAPACPWVAMLLPRPVRGRDGALLRTDDARLRRHEPTAHGGHARSATG